MGLASPCLDAEYQKPPRWSNTGRRRELITRPVEYLTWCKPPTPNAGSVYRIPDPGGAGPDRSTSQHHSLGTVGGRIGGVRTRAELGNPPYSTEISIRHTQWSTRQEAGNAIGEDSMIIFVRSTQTLAESQIGGRGRFVVCREDVSGRRLGRSCPHGAKLGQKV